MDPISGLFGGGGNQQAQLEEAIVSFGIALVSGFKDMTQKAVDEIKKRIEEQKRFESEQEKE